MWIALTRATRVESRRALDPYSRPRPPRSQVATDFVALALADVHFGIGDSSFLGNAAAAGLTDVVRVSDRVPSGASCRALEPKELRAVVESMRAGASGAVQAAAADRARHVEL